jgi:hypothetical protein
VAGRESTGRWQNPWITRPSGFEGVRLAAKPRRASLGKFRVVYGHQVRKLIAALRIVETSIRNAR